MSNLQKSKSSNAISAPVYPPKRKFTFKSNDKSIKKSSFGGPRASAGNLAISQ